MKYKLLNIILLLLSLGTVKAQMMMLPDSMAMMGAPCQEMPLVKDHQGNWYRTVQIGKQCWMAENMRCTTSPSGKHWISNPTFTVSAPLFSSYYVQHQVQQYGYLYNWAAAMDVNREDEDKLDANAQRRGICPQGWHLPSSDEWSILVNVLGGSHVAGAMMKCPSSLWESPVFSPKGECGFSAMPAGLFTEEGMSNLGYDAQFWSSSTFNRSMAWCCGLYSYNNNSLNSLDYKCYARSVRCVMD